MKEDFHPVYHPVAFQDMTTGTRFITRSTAKSAKVEQIDGVDHYIISSGVTSDTHPFFTGQRSEDIELGVDHLIGKLCLTLGSIKEHDAC